MESNNKYLYFSTNVYTVLHLYILIYFQDIEAGSLQIRLHVGLHETRFSTASGAEELDIHSSFYLRHQKFSRDHHQDEGYQDR